jgi:rare lipoprotein A
MPNKKILCFLAVTIFVLALSSCAPKHVPRGKVPSGTYKPYRVGGKTYYPLPSSEGFEETGYASWYGPNFHGRKTASGETYNMYSLTAAHKILPMNTYVRVENLKNGKSLVVRINDRGPFVRNRIIDLSYTAAKKLGIVGPGTAKVRITALGETRTAKSGRLYFASHPDFRHGDFYIQVGAFKNASNAYRLRKRLARRFRVVRVERAYTFGNLFYKVQIDAPNSYDRAKEFEKSIENTGFPSAFLVAR